MTMPRQVVPGRTHLISRRCTQRLCLLRPDDRMNQIYEYCIGEAAERYGITLHGWLPMSNHQHMLVRDNLGNFPEFLAHLNKMLAKVVNALRGRWENVWATEQPNAVYQVEASDRFDALIYVLANPVNDRLVERAADWPGATSLQHVLSGKPFTVKRPKEFFGDDSRMPEEVTLRCERPDGFEHLTQEEWRKMVLDAIAVEERRARDERREGKKGILGRKGVLRTDPLSAPQTVAPRGGLRPNVACKNRERRILELEALRAFRAAYRSVFKKWVERAKDILFPAGTYRLRLFGIPCAPFGALLGSAKLPTT